MGVIPYLGLKYLELIEFLRFFSNVLKSLFSPPFRKKEFIEQLYFVMNKSLFIVVFCVSFAAVVTIIESSFHMKIVIKNDSLVPGFAALLILRELGAVVTSLLLTSRVGAGYAAETGSMKITEQLEALQMLGINKINFIVVPRFLACIVAGLVLTIVANAACLFFALIVTEAKLGYGLGAFVSSMRAFVSYQDFIFSAIKGTVFASVIPLISCFYGFKCQSGAEGVGQTTTKTVVTTTIVIIGLDFFLSWFFSYFY